MGTTKLGVGLRIHLGVAPEVCEKGVALKVGETTASQFTPLHDPQTERLKSEDYTVSNNACPTFFSWCIVLSRKPRVNLWKVWQKCDGQQCRPYGGRINVLGALRWDPTISIFGFSPQV